MELKRQVLVVEDNLFNRELLTEILKDHYEVIQAENGQEALDVLKRNKGSVDLILLDVMMPVMNGIEVIEKINNSSISKKPKFILVTADLGSEFVNNAYSLGVLNVVGKVSPENALKYAIEEFLYLQNTNESDIIEKHQVKKESFFEKILKKIKE